MAPFSPVQHHLNRLGLFDTAAVDGYCWGHHTAAKTAESVACLKDHAVGPVADLARSGSRMNLENVDQGLDLDLVHLSVSYLMDQEMKKGR